jgi:hypothetical protein
MAHEVNTEEENSGYVIFKRNIHRLAVEYGGGEGWGRRYSARPPPPHIFLSRLLGSLDEYLKTT